MWKFTPNYFCLAIWHFLVKFWFIIPVFVMYMVSQTNTFWYHGKTRIYILSPYLFCLRFHKLTLLDITKKHVHIHICFKIKKKKLPKNTCLANKFESPVINKQIYDWNIFLKKMCVALYLNLKGDTIVKRVSFTYFYQNSRFRYLW